MTGPISNGIYDREQDKFVESPSRPGKTAVEVVFSGSVASGSSSNLETRNAAETLSALKCVYAFSSNSVKLANNNQTLSNALVFGITITAAQVNESTLIQTSGTLRDSSFTFSAGTILYLGINGSITSTPPTVGFLTQVAVAQGPGQIFINIKETLTL